MPIALVETVSKFMGFGGAVAQIPAQRAGVRMDFFQELPAPLLRLKVLIWVHAALGALLLIGIPVLALATDQKELAAWTLPALFAWGFGVGPLRKKAEGLAPEDRLEAKGLPGWVPILVGTGGLLCPLWFADPFGLGVAAAWLFLATTIAIRWGLSRNVAVPVHGKTWGGMLVALSLPLGFILLLLLIIVCSGME